MKRAPKTSKTFPNCKFDKKFAAYTLAGAAVLAAPVVARANSITYDPNVDVIVNQPGTIAFNLSGPSAADIVLSATTGTVNNDLNNEITVATSNGAEVASFYGPEDLSYGTSIDSSTGKFTTSGLLASYDTITGSNSAAPWSWAPDTSGYLGFYFDGTSGPQTGWADISTGAEDASFEVLSYAYQDQPNMAIDAGQIAETPEPPALLLLATGALGLLWLRRRRAAIA